MKNRKVTIKANIDDLIKLARGEKDLALASSLEKLSGSDDPPPKLRASLYKSYVTITPETKRCVFNESWVGQCKNITLPWNDMCEKHHDKKCVCGNVAVTNCESTMGPLVCGSPICKNHYKKHEQLCTHCYTRHERWKQDNGYS